MRFLTLVAICAIAAPSVERAPRFLAALGDAGTTWRAHEKAAAEFLAAAGRLLAIPGPALCESLLLCYEAGKPLIVDPFIARSDILSGRASEDALVADIAQHRFAVIVMPYELQRHPKSPDRIVSDVLTEGRFTQATLTAIYRHYVVAGGAPGAVFYVPKDGGPDCAAAPCSAPETQARLPAAG